MTWTDFLDYLQHFRTDKVLEQLAAWNIDDLSSNPYVLAGFAVAIGITYLIGWKTTSAFLVGIGGFALAVSYTVKQGTGIEGVGGGLPLLVGSGLIVVIIFIYLLFIKAE
ncbi:MAG: hypothetical protein C0619_06140 [Desulfuromonas sp.]|jgi:hypothetical protein|nr:MAG: hypothetical protein C0619_06140 [Desulfuromonas sp.]